MIKRLLAAILLFPVCGLAETFIANSASRADVVGAIALASSGDTVEIPAGEATWTNNIALSIPLTIKGAGTNSTVITLLSSGINLHYTGFARVTGIKFLSSATSSSAYHVRADNDYWFEIDNCHFESTVSSKQLAVYAASDSGRPWPSGLVWDCSFYNVRILYQGDLGTGFGRDVWADAGTVFGTATNTLFVEDCDFINTVGGNSMDNEYGGLYVSRFNSIQDSTLEAHGITSSSERGSKAVEIYGNTFTRTVDDYYRPTFLRGGSFRVFDNTFSGPWNQQIQIDNEANRSTSVLGYSAANGNESPADGSGDGTHTGGDSATVLTSTTNQNWTTDEWVAVLATASTFTGYVWTVVNVTDGSSGQVTANTSNTVTVAALTGGSDNTWQSGDTYKITDGYPWRDQIGVGTDAFLYTGTGDWPTQDKVPAYQWNNNHDGTNKAASWGASDQADFQLTNTSGNQQRVAQNDRDFFQYVASGFDGTTGVGRGTAAQMAAITPTLDNVGFWVTDEGEWNSESAGADGRLYVWNGSAWELDYTPYTYPHPLRTIDGPDETAPTILTATIGTDGTTLTLAYSEAVSQGAGYSDAHITIDASTTGAGLAVTYSSGNGTASHVYTVASTIFDGETVTLDFSGTANSLEDAAGNDLAAIVDRSVTNNSNEIEGGGAPDDAWPNAPDSPAGRFWMGVP